MEQIIYSIFDDKAVMYCRPFFLQSVGLALRSFADICKDRESQIAHHPADFKLYKLGTFNDNTGSITPLAIPEFVASASEYVQKNISQNQIQNQIQNQLNLQNNDSEA